MTRMAAAMFEYWVNQNLEDLVLPVFMPGALFQDDHFGNRFGVHLFRDGRPEPVNGAVSAKVTRSDGEVITVGGTASGNDAYIILPEDAYTIPGHIQIVIRVGTTTIASFRGNVKQTITDEIIS